MTKTTRLRIVRSTSRFNQPIQRLERQGGGEGSIFPAGKWLGVGDGLPRIRGKRTQKQKTEAWSQVTYYRRMEARFKRMVEGGGRK